MDNDETQRAKRKKLIKWLTVSMFLLLITVCLLLVRSYFKGRFNSVESFQNYMGQFGIWSPVALGAFQFCQVVIPVLPGFLGCAAGAVMFGPFVGFIVNYIGISLGSMMAFFLARKYGTPLIEDLFPMEKYTAWSNRLSESKSYAAFLFAAFALPVFPDDFLCYFTGVTKMSWKEYSMILWLGKPWSILAYSLGFGLIK